MAIHMCRMAIIMMINRFQIIIHVLNLKHRHQLDTGDFTIQSDVLPRAKGLPLWKNKALIGGLSSQAIVIVDTALQPVQQKSSASTCNSGFVDLIEAKDGSHLGD